MTFTPRRILFILVATGFIFLNPVHLPWTLPWLAEQQAGTAFGDFLLEKQGPITIAGTVYFTAVMVPVYYWLWNRRRKKPSPATASSPSASDDTVEEGYRGPGGGKRLPSSVRRRQRRRRR